MLLAFVLLKDGSLPSADEVVKAYKSVNTDGPPLLKDVSTEESVLAFKLGPEPLLAALMPGPVPNGEADDAARFSISRAPIARHGAHLVLTCPGKTSQYARSDFTTAVAAVALAAKAVGVYWGPGHVTHPTDFFVDGAKEKMHALLWNGVSIASEPKDRVSLLSLGMTDLGLKDLVVTAPRVSANEAMGFFADLLTFVIERGETPPEGDTVGRDDHEQLEVRYEKSPVDEKVTVWRVDLPDIVSA